VPYIHLVKVNLLLYSQMASRWDFTRQAERQTARQAERQTARQAARQTARRAARQAAREGARRGVRRSRANESINVRPGSKLLDAFVVYHRAFPAELQNAI